MKINKMFSILKGVVEGVFTAVVFVFIPIILLTLLSSRSMLIGGFQSFTVLSGSMSPLITTGSVVYTLPVQDVKVGEIITFKRGNINVTHRIIDTVDKDGKHRVQLIGSLKNDEIFYKTKGDANNSADNELVSKNQVIGSVLFHFPELGKFASFIKSIPGFISLIIVPTLVFVSFELWNIKKEFEKEIEKKTLKRYGLGG